MTRTSAYNNYMSFCNMIDLGFFGPTFTQTNLKDIDGLIQTRIDKCWANPSWALAFLKQMLPTYLVLTRTIVLSS